MSEFVLGELSIDVEEVAPDRIALHWRGVSNSRNPDEALRSFFGLVFARAMVREVVLELHFEHLSHFNSATIAAVVRLTEEARVRKLRLELSYDGSKRWQEHSFDGLAVLVRPDGLLTIRAVTPGPHDEAVGH